MLISGLWGVLFLADALVIALHAGALATTGLFVFGAVASIFGPKIFVRAAVQHKIDTAERYRWPAPRFAGAKGEGEGEVDVAVVGAGIGGLAAAALLADAGLKVAVFEAHVVPGGYCHTFLRKVRHHGQACVYRFDAGPHDFSGLSPGGALTSTLQRLGVAESLDRRRLDHRYTFSGRTIDVPHDWRDYVALLGPRFPATPPDSQRCSPTSTPSSRACRRRAATAAAFPERRATSRRCWRSCASIRWPCAGWTGRSTNSPPAISAIPRRGA